MPITLGCTACGKRFKARDESAGKKVKCPYCQVAVQVPTPEEADRAGGSAAPLPDSAPVPVAGPRQLPSVPVVASPDEWGALPTAPPPPAAPKFPPPLDPRDHEPFPLMPPPPAPERGGKDRPEPVKSEKAGTSPRVPKEKEPATGWGESPEQVLAAGWRSMRRGLFWVRFGLLFLFLIGFAGIGKSLYSKFVGKLPEGDGTEWVSIPEYVNAPGQKAVALNKTELLDLALYGGPVLLGSLFIVLGRLIASRAPRHSGARGLFAFSALFGFAGTAALFVWFAFAKMQLREEEKYAQLALLILLPLAEFWFLTALTASGLALMAPKTAGAVGTVGFLAALTAFTATLGWDLYQQNWRLNNLNDDLRMYEQAALLLGWLILVGSYWRAVGKVRRGAREFLDTVAGG
jgi:phage FluMu protein Com